MSKGKVTVKDFNGNTYSVDKDDSRYLSGELVFISKGLIDVIYNDNIFKCKPNDPSVLNGTYKQLSHKHKYVDINTDEILFLYKEDKRVINKEVVKYSSYVVNVKDKDGNLFTVLKSDKRLQTNELIHINRKHTFDCSMHGLQTLENGKRFKDIDVPEEYKVYCIKCKEYYLSDEYVPSEKDKQKCLQFLSNFNFVVSNQQTEKYFKDKIPHFYKIIINNYELIKDKFKDISFAQKIYLFKCNNVIPKCGIEGCNNEVPLYKNGFAFHLYCDKHEFNYYSSRKERELKDYIASIYEGEITSKKDIDIYLPQLNLAFEFNGVYWHSDKFKDKDSHYKEYDNLKNKGIQLITIWEDDWDLKQKIVKSIISNKLGKTTHKIYARKCLMNEVSFKECKQFLNENHLQGYCVSKINLGLYYNDELVSLMTFGKKRKILGSKSNDNEYELLRFCNRINTTVIGGASKLFKHFIHIYNPNTILSFANCDISDGNLYEKLGFNFKCKTKVNYWWMYKGVRVHRSSFMKHKLVADGFDECKTEDTIMKERGYHKVYGTGNLKYEWKKSLKPRRIFII